MVSPWIIIGAWVVIVSAALRVLFVSWQRRHVADRLFGETLSAREADVVEQPGLVRRWLFLAGFRTEQSPMTFWLVTAILSIVGVVFAWFSGRSAMYEQGLRLLGGFPGGVGEVFIPIFYIGPWVVALLLASLPWLLVQRARRARVSDMERDLPVTLELLATLSEAGLGFDAALARVLDSQSQDSVLKRELSTFQLDTLSGRARTNCFRRLAARAEVQALSIFVSAIVQAEQVGAGVAGVLRQQANDLRDRRREDAMALAMALPIKRLFPMMICFLPGIFVATLGPTFFQFFQYADTILRLQSFGGIP